MSLLSDLAYSLFKKTIDHQVQLAITETDNTFNVGGYYWNSLYRDRFDTDRDTIIEEALKAWRTNPLARRIVDLTSQPSPLNVVSKSPEAALVNVNESRMAASAKMDSFHVMRLVNMLWNFGFFVLSSTFFKQ